MTSRSPALTRRTLCPQARFETIADASWNAHGPLRWDEGSAELVSRMEARLLDHIHTTETEEMVYPFGAIWDGAVCVCMATGAVSWNDGS